MNIIEALKEERSKLTGQLSAIDSAIAALSLNGNGASPAKLAKEQVRPVRQMSASARLRISKAQKARWAAVRNGAKNGK